MGIGGLAGQGQQLDQGRLPLREEQEQGAPGEGGEDEEGHVEHKGRRARAGRADAQAQIDALGGDEPAQLRRGRRACVGRGHGAPVRRRGR